MSRIWRRGQRLFDTRGVSKVGFAAPLVEGHKGVTVVIAPFDPREVWGVAPVALDARREGWLVTGTMNGAAFNGWIGFRWGRYFIIVDAALRKAAKVGVGDEVEVVVRSTTSAKALAVAKEQAPLTTAPGKRRSTATRTTRHSTASRTTRRSTATRTKRTR
jgi:hypothetical protein